MYNPKEYASLGGYRFHLGGPPGQGAAVVHPHHFSLGQHQAVMGIPEMHFQPEELINAGKHDLHTFMI